MSMRYRILAMNMAAMLCYSAAFIWRGETGMGGWSAQPLIMAQWGVLLLHVAGLIIAGLSKGRPPEQRSAYLMAAALVALVGHGMCFYNGAENAAWN